MPVTVAAAADQRASAKRRHVVQFYGHDAQLTQRVAAFIGPALAQSEAAVVIATERHRSAIDAELRARRLDVDDAIASGRYVRLDAAQTLSRYIVDGRPDAARFHEVVGGVLDAALARTGRKHVRAFGEMVALLWLAGRADSALGVERLWNELRASRPLELLCGYPVAAFRNASAADAATVAALHTQVAPV